MPREAELLVDDLLEEYLNLSYWLRSFQERAIGAYGQIQNMRHWEALKFATPVNARIAGLNKTTQDYFAREMERVYLAGGRSIDPAFDVTLARRGLSQQSRQLAKLNMDGYLHLRNANQSTMDDTKRFLSMIWNDTGARRSRQEIKYTHVDIDKDLTIRRRGIKATALKGNRQYEFGNYTSMVIRQQANRAYNMGVIHAAEQKKIKYLRVSDGPECGWTYHEDPTTANGMVVTLQEAAAFPVAHPNCQRTFSPATEDDYKKGNKVPKTTNEQVKQAAKVGLLTAAGVVGAAGASNLLEAGLRTGLQRLASSQYLDDAISRLMQQALNGDPVIARLVQHLNKFRADFAPDFLNTEASVTPIYPGAPTPDIPLWQEIRAYADGTLNDGLGLNKVPAKIKAALGKAEHELLDDLPDRFQAFYKAGKDFALAKDNVENIFRVIEFERQRRRWFDFVLKNIPGTPEFRLNWTPYGNRVKANLTSWMRAGTTITKTGPVSSLTAHALDRSVRGMVRIYQDGLMGGHISVLPKEFLKGAVRAIVEINQDGRLVGNIRLVPGGPLRVTLRFGQKYLRDIMPSDEDLLSAANMLTKSFDWPASVREKAVKDLQYLWKIRNHQLPLDLRDIKVSPAGFVANVYERFQNFEFKSLDINLRIFNQSVFEVSTALKIPVNDTIVAMRKLAREGMVKAGTILPDGIPRWTGTFRYLIQNPERAKELLSVGRATLFGNVRFANLSSDLTERSLVLRTLKNLNIRQLTKAKIEDLKLQSIVTDMRIHGWTIYDIANVMEVKAVQIKYMVDNGLARIQGIMQDMGVLRPEDIGPMWNKRLWDAMARVQRREQRVVGRAEVIKRGVESLGEDSERITERANILMDLAGVKPGQPPNVIYNKLKNTMEYIRWQEFESEDLANTVAELNKEINLRHWAERISKVGEWKRTLNVTGGADDVLFDATTGSRYKSILDSILKKQSAKIWSDLRAIPMAPSFTDAANNLRVVYEKYSPANHVTDWLTRIEEKKIRFPEIKVGPWRVISEVPGIHPLDATERLYEDFFSEMDFMMQRFPKVTWHPELRIVSEGHSPFYFPGEGYFGVPATNEFTERNSEAYKIFHGWQQWVDDLHAKNLVTNDSHNYGAVWIHEYSHYLTDEVLKVRPSAFQQLQYDVADALDLPHRPVFRKIADPDNLGDYNELYNDFSRKPSMFFGWSPKTGGTEETATSIVSWIGTDLGYYANKDMWEFIAEAETEYLTSPNPSRLARVVGEWMDATLNRGYTFG